MATRRSIWGKDLERYERKGWVQVDAEANDKNAPGVITVALKESIVTAAPETVVEKPSPVKAKFKKKGTPSK